MTRNVPSTPGLPQPSGAAEPSPARKYSHYEVAYIKLRTSMAVLSLALPLGLLGITFVLRSATQLPPSMSDYYSAGELERNLLVAMLSCLGILLLMYEGYSRLENRVLDVAGALLVGVAFCHVDLQHVTLHGLQIPVAWTLDVFGVHPRLSVHGLCAVGFFGCMIYVSTVLSGQTLRDREPAVQCRWLVRYWLVSATMVLTMGAALVLHQMPWALFRGKVVFWVEAAGVVAFAVFWLMKTKEVNPTMTWHAALRPLKPAAEEVREPHARLARLGRPEALHTTGATALTAAAAPGTRRSALCAALQWIERRLTPAGRRAVRP